MGGVTTPRSALAGTGRESWRVPVSYLGIGRLVLCLDVVLIAATSVLSGIAYHLATVGHAGDLEAYVGVAAMVAALVIPGLILRGHYDPRALLASSLDLKPVVMTWAGALLFLAGVAFSLKIGDEFSRGAVLAFAGAGGAALCLHRVAWYLVLKSGRLSAVLRRSKVVLISHRAHDGVGRSELMADLRSSGHQVLRQLELSSSASDHAELEAEILAALGDVRGSDAEAIFLAVPWQALSGRFLRHLSNSPLPVRLVPERWAADLITKPSVTLGSFTAVEIKRAPLTETEQFCKRVLDIACAATGLVVLSPLLAITALTVRLDTPGPILFRQTRHGFNGKPFKIYKFRSMSVLEDGPQVRQASRVDSRVTAVGYWIRRLSIDELPQLINVLRGEMSIVGPRPHAVAHDNYYNDIIAKYAFRHHVKPGLTGLAQVKGYRGETPKVELMARRIDYDIRYIDTWSFWLDIKIILHTAFELVRTRRAY
jgi:Undecaprenyl-phosphate glucose phosphotransferase